MQNARLSRVFPSIFAESLDTCQLAIFCDARMNVPLIASLARKAARSLVNQYGVKSSFRPSRKVRKIRENRLARKFRFNLGLHY